jgi:hypothetical protein
MYRLQWQTDGGELNGIVGLSVSVIYNVIV